MRRTANILEDRAVTSNNVGDIELNSFTDPDAGGGFLALDGTMLIGNKAWFAFADFGYGMPDLGYRATGHVTTEGTIAVSGGHTYDADGEGSGAGTELIFMGGTLVKGVCRETSTGNVRGKLNMAITPVVAVLLNYTGTGTGIPASQMSTAVQVKMTPISFETYSTISTIPD